MEIIRYVAIFLILTTLGMLYDRYKKKYDPDDELSKYHLVQKYLLNEDTILTGKPILWVHTDHGVNARKWEDFGSRNTEKLNQKYIELCIETIIKHCSQSFNVCLINDETFAKLIPSWNLDLDKLSNPVKSHMRSLGILKLLYYYGGMVIPNSMIAMKDLKPLYDNTINSKGCFVGEFVSRNLTSTHTRFFPSHRFMGTKKKCHKLDYLIKEYEKLLKDDSTTEMDINGSLDKLIYRMCKQGKIHIVSGRMLGTKNKCDEVVVVDDLLQSSYVSFDPEIVGVYLPKDEIISRTKYKWFAYLSRSELFNCDTIAAKQLIISHGK